MRESPNNYNTSLTHKNIPSKIEHKRQSVKIENPRSSWTMALSRSIITQAIHHQPPIKAKYNNYFVLRGRAPPRYVSSVHVRTVSNFDGKFLLHRRRYTNAALKNAGKKLMWRLHTFNGIINMFQKVVLAIYSSQKVNFRTSSEHG